MLPPEYPATVKVSKDAHTMLTPEEMLLLRDAAWRCRLSVSSYIRRVLLHWLYMHSVDGRG